jgi:hypothetical protein
MVLRKHIAAFAVVALSAAGVASGATYAATAGAAGAKACVTSSGVLELLKGNGTCPAGSGPAVLGAQGPAGPAGTTILSGQVPPGIGRGLAGDYYIDTATHFLYGPAVRDCSPYPCRTLWGKGISLVGPAGPASTSPAGGTAYQATGFANLPNGSSTVIDTLPLSAAGYYSVTATVNAQHKGDDNTNWSCSLLGAEPNGQYQNYTESDASLQGDGAASSVSIPLVAGVEVVAGEKLEVSCIEFQAKKGDSAGADILATMMSSIAGAMNP